MKLAVFAAGVVVGFVAAANVLIPHIDRDHMIDVSLAELREGR